MRLRSPLFAPGDSERKMTKAIASAADAVILDLEDSVAAPAKPTARAMVPRRGARASGPGADRAGQSARHAVVSGRSGRRGAGRGRPRACAAEMQRAGRPGRRSNHHLEALEAAAGAPIGSIGVVAIVTETAGSVFALGEYAPVASRLLAICFGAEDLSADLGISPRHPTVAIRRRSCWRAPRCWWRPGRSGCRRSTRLIRTTATRSGCGGRRRRGRRWVRRQDPDPPGADRRGERRVHAVRRSRCVGPSGSMPRSPPTRIPACSRWTAR